MPKVKDNLVRSLFPAAILALSGCGIQSDKNLFSDDQSLLATRQAQQEIYTVLAQTQNAIVGSFAPNEDIGPRFCEPKSRVILVGVRLSFTASEECLLQGDITVRLFPTRAEVDLEVVGLEFVKRISFEADIDFRKGNGIFVGFRFLDGRLNLSGSDALPVSELVLNSRADFTIGNGNLVVDSRTNAFESNSGLGVAFLVNMNRLEGTSAIQGCLINGGEPLNPDAGQATSCFEI